METEIRNIFSKKLVTSRDTDTLSDADELMEIYKIRHLPVLNQEDALVGILSKTDYMGLKHTHSKLHKYFVKDLMSSPVKVVASSAKLSAVAQLFITQKINCAMVIDDDEVLGIVTSEDLIRLLAHSHDSFGDTELLDLKAMAEEGWISSTSLT